MKNWLPKLRLRADAAKLREKAAAKVEAANAEDASIVEGAKADAARIAAETAATIGERFVEADQEVASRLAAAEGRAAMIVAEPIPQRWLVKEAEALLAITQQEAVEERRAAGGSRRAS